MKEKLMVSSLGIKAALDRAIAETAAQYANGVAFSRKRKLSLDTMLHFLIAAEGGSLAKELHRTGIDATPPLFPSAALKFYPILFGQCFSGSTPLVRTMKPFAAIRFWRWMGAQSIFLSTRTLTAFSTLIHTQGAGITHFILRRCLMC